MKKIIVILVLILTSFICIGQTKPDTCFTQTEMIELANKFLQYKHADSVNNFVISQLSYQLELFKTLHRNDSLIIKDYQLQIELIKDQNGIYKMFQKDTKLKWYDSKILWFAGGVTTVFISSMILNNSIN